MKYGNFRSTIFLFALFVVANQLSAQYKKGEFFGNFDIAVNFCQIDGDGASGFNKFGLTAGYTVGQVLKEAENGHWAYLGGAAFSVRGSRRPFDTENPSAQSFHFVYQMIDIPLFLSRSYGKFSAGAGVRTTYLISAEDRDNFVLSLQSSMRTVNMLGCAFGDYEIKPGLRALLEFQYSINSMRAGDTRSAILFPTGVYHNVISMGIRYQPGSKK